MKHSEIAALMKGVAPVIRDLVLASLKPLADRVVELERQLAEHNSFDHAQEIAAAVSQAVAALPETVPGRSLTPDDVAPMLAGMVNDAVEALPPAEPGKSVDIAEVRRMIDDSVRDAVAEIPVPQNGKDVDMSEVAAMLGKAVAEAVEALPPAEPGKSVDIAEVRRMIDDSVRDAVAEIPVPQNGKDVDMSEVAAMLSKAVAEAVEALPPAEPGKSVSVEDLTSVIDEAVSMAVSRLPPPIKGDAGPQGKLPVAKEWDGGVTYEAGVRVHNGSLWQAVRDTGREPGHEDWICIAAAGARGIDADQIEVCGTYDAEAAYKRLNVVALNGGAFIAKRDAPGACPGEGWQVIAMRGKAGAPGEGRKGEPGKSVKGEPGEPVVSISVSDEAVLTLVNGDGSTAECDLYPLLRKISVDRHE